MLICALISISLEFIFYRLNISADLSWKNLILEAITGAFVGWLVYQMGIQKNKNVNISKTKHSSNMFANSRLFSIVLIGSILALLSVVLMTVHIFPYSPIIICVSLLIGGCIGFWINKKLSVPPSNHI